MKQMTPKQYQKALDELELSQLAASRLFEIGPRTSRRWASGEARVPNAVAILLNLMLNKEYTLEVPVVPEGSRTIDSFRIWKLKANAPKLEAG